jgi:hypothetical protein
MADDQTLQLINLSTGEIIAPLSNTRVQELKRYLEQESPTDTNFYIRPETIEFLRSRGADELADLLATALGDTQGVIVGYAPICNTGSMRVHGRVLALESNSPLTGYKIEVFDEDIAFDDLLGWCYSDPQGKFALRFEESAFKDSAIEGQPELELRISDLDGAELGWVGILSEPDSDFGDVFISASGKVIAPVAYPGSAMICPNCGSLYRAGFTTCSEDQTPLVRLEYNE